MVAPPVSAARLREEAQRSIARAAAEIARETGAPPSVEAIALRLRASPGFVRARLPSPPPKGPETMKPSPRFPSAAAWLTGYAFDLRAPHPEGGEIVAHAVATPDGRLISLDVVRSERLTQEERAQIGLIRAFSGAMVEERALSPKLEELLAALPAESLVGRLLLAVLAQHPQACSAPLAGVSS